MEEIYSNVDHSDNSNQKCSHCRGNQVSSSKCTKVLLTVLSVSLVLALGGLCVLGIMYARLSVKLSAQETKSTPASVPAMERELKELMSNYTRVREQLSFYETFSTQSLNCEMILTAWDGKLYYFSSFKLDWSSSRAFCVSKGADLVIITSLSEQMFLISKMKDWYWIGLNDLDTEGRWVWVNSQTLTETGVQFWYKRNTQKSEPDDWRVEDPNGEDCAIVKNDVSDLNNWFDVSCNYKLKFICAKKHFLSVLNVNYILSDFLILNKLKQHSSLSGHVFCQTHEMDSVYENTDFILSTVASDENRSQFRSKGRDDIGNSSKEQEREREVHPPKWTKVLLIFLAICLVFALGGLCILGILYTSVSVKLSAQQTNGTIMERGLEVLKANYTNYKEQFDALQNQHEETLRKLNRFNHSTGCALCSIHWIHFGGKCYFFSTVKMNWTQSRDHCVTLGGHLVIIDSQAEQDFLTSKVKVTHWIGLNDLDTEGHWFWVNNQPLNDSVEFWMKRENGISEPDNWTKEDEAGEDCASLGHPAGETDFWTDAFCFEKKRFVCEAAAAV
ncbi:macrophage mannose receptor 1-like [Chanodichthys erythropterus]|uniref:macrophage mannose receptor 1-like n=1 Tax=Chanodichthys erythropterus TaxID=933992 RepID=UPI00351E94EF